MVRLGRVQSRPPAGPVLAPIVPPPAGDRARCAPFDRCRGPARCPGCRSGPGQQVCRMRTGARSCAASSPAERHDLRRRASDAVSSSCSMVLAVSRPTPVTATHGVAAHSAPAENINHVRPGLPCPPMIGTPRIARPGSEPLLVGINQAQHPHLLAPCCAGSAGGAGSRRRSSLRHPRPAGRLAGHRGRSG